MKKLLLLALFALVVGSFSASVEAGVRDAADSISQKTNDGGGRPNPVVGDLSTDTKPQPYACHENHGFCVCTGGKYSEDCNAMHHNSKCGTMTCIENVCVCDLPNS